MATSIGPVDPSSLRRTGLWVPDCADRDRNASTMVGAFASVA